MYADVRDVGKGTDPRNNRKDQRDENRNPFGAFKVGILSL